MSGEDKFTLFSSASGLLAVAALVVQAWTELGEQILMTAPLALAAILSSLVAIGGFPGVPSKRYRAWLALLVGLIVLSNGIFDEIGGRTAKKALYDSLDARTRAVVVALDAFQVREGRCPESLDALVSSDLPSTLLYDENGDAFYDFDRERCVISVTIAR